METEEWWKTGKAWGCLSHKWCQVNIGRWGLTAKRFKHWPSRVVSRLTSWECLSIVKWMMNWSSTCWAKWARYGPHPPMSTLHQLDVIHACDKWSLFFFCCFSTSTYGCQCSQITYNMCRLGNEAIMAPSAEWTHINDHYISTVQITLAMHLVLHSWVLINLFNSSTPAGSQWH